MRSASRRRRGNSAGKSWVMMLQSVSPSIPAVAVDQAITRGDDHPPRDLLVRAPDLVRNVCGRFAEQFKSAYGCIVAQAAVEKLGLGELSRIAQRSFPEAKHVQNVKPPFARSLTHEGLRVR